MSIPEIATQIVDETLSQEHEDNSSTIFLVGSKSVGKTTLLNYFLEKPDIPRETLVLEYSFGRKSNQKRGFEKTLCHIWEYGGKIETLKNILPAIPIQGKYFFCIVLDLSKIKEIWDTLEMSIQTMNEIYLGSTNMPELIFVGGKYDIFKNYDIEIKKFVCITVRSVALIHKAHLLFYSSKDSQLIKRTKEILQNMGFGNSVYIKEKNTNFTKPLIIPKGADSWENIGLTESTYDQVKARHVSRISLNTKTNVPSSTTTQKSKHPEPTLDSLAAIKYEELRNTELLDLSTLINI